MNSHSTWCLHCWLSSWNRPWTWILWQVLFSSLFLVSYLGSSMFSKDLSLATFLLSTVCQRLILYLTYSMFKWFQSLYIQTYLELQTQISWSLLEMSARIPFRCLKLSMCSRITHCPLLSALLSPLWAHHLRWWQHHGPGLVMCLLTSPLSNNTSSIHSCY